jgi:hypothetical protein
MGRAYDEITPAIAEWLGAQHLFFVATAPLDGDGRVNLSPKGHDTFRILDRRRVAYLDLTGSGIETVAHVRENGRITLLFCGFEGPPRLVRIYGRARPVVPGDDGWEALVARFGAHRGARAVIDVDVRDVRDSCGYSVPLMAYQGERDRLVEWASHRSDDELVEYRRTNNATSLDGLEGLDGPGAPEARSGRDRS